MPAHAHAEKYRYVIAAAKALMGISEVSGGLLFLLASQGATHRLFVHLANQYRTISPQLATTLQTELAKAEQHKTGLSLLLLALGVCKLVAALGFALKKPWGYYILLALVGCYLPYDLYEITRHVGVFSVGSGCLDLVFLLLLLRFRHYFSHESPASETGSKTG